MKHDPMYSLPVGDIESLKRVFECIEGIQKSHDEDGTEWDSFRKLKFFFMQALYPFYDCMWDGMETKVGHIIYRLSDLVPIELRTKIVCYLGKDTLENFRKEWEENYNNIPELNQLLIEDDSLANSIKLLQNNT